MFTDLLTAGEGPDVIQGILRLRMAPCFLREVIVVRGGKGAVSVDVSRIQTLWVS